jgi:hypothetical protein
LSTLSTLSTWKTSTVGTSSHQPSRNFGGPHCVLRCRLATHVGQQWPLARGPLHNAGAANRYDRSWATPNHSRRSPQAGGLWLCDGLPKTVAFNEAGPAQFVVKGWKLRRLRPLVVQYAEAIDAACLLRPRRERPRRRRAAEQRDERAALHSITSSGATSRPRDWPRPIIQEMRASN